MSVPEEHKRFSEIWASTLWLIPENPTAGGRHVIQQLCRWAVNDRMCQIMNNELDHKWEEEGLRRSSRIVCTLPAIIKLKAYSWEGNQAASSRSKPILNPPTPAKMKDLFWKLFRMFRSKVISTFKTHRRGWKSNESLHKMSLITHRWSEAAKWGKWK